MLILGSLSYFSRFPKEFIGLIDSFPKPSEWHCGRGFFDDPLRFQRRQFYHSRLLWLLSLFAAIGDLASTDFASLWLYFPW
jgi:hypothetical protein